MKPIKVKLSHYFIEPTLRKKYGKMMCQDEAELWAEAYINSAIEKCPYDLDLRIFYSLPFCIRRLINIKLNSMYHIRIS